MASVYNSYKELMDSNCLKIDKLENGKLRVSRCDASSESEHVHTLSKRKQDTISFMNSLNKKIISKDNIKLDKPIEVLIMEQLGIKRYCCKRILLGHIDILKIL